MKSYARDPAKEKSRQLLKGMIESTLLKFMRPQNIRVLHLPGPDGMEYKKVYEPLGVPPQNVDGLEQNTEIAELARKANPRTNIINTTLSDFVKEGRLLDYNIVSLDSTGNFSVDTLNDAATLGIFLKPNNFLYHVALQKRRENIHSQDLLKRLAVAYSSLGTLRKPLNDVFPEVKQIPDELDSLRDYGLAYLMLSITNRMRRDRIYEVLEICKNVLGSEYENSLTMLLESRGDNVKLRHPKYGIDPSKLDDFSDIFFHGMLLLTKIKLYNQFYGAFKTGNPLFPSDRAKVYANACAEYIMRALFYDHIKKSIVIEDLKKYAYVSESGTPMIGDIGYFRNDFRIFSAYNELLNQVTIGDQFRIRDFARLVKAVRRVESLGDRQKFHSLDDYLIQREFLGSSAKPILRHDKAVELILEGKNPADIAAHYRGLGIGTLRAIKIHSIRGTYDKDKLELPAPNKQSMKDLKQDIEARVLLAEEGLKINGQQLGKNDAIEYLRAGISPREIHSAYPETSLPQIIAWDFWLKKGKYDK